MSEPKHRFTLILPVWLWEKIKSLAKRNRRPITQEMLLAIEEHIADSEQASPSATEKGSAP